MGNRLLTGNEFKMHGAIPVRYLEDECDPPYLLNFKGTVAERHVENLKVSISSLVGRRSI